jgi:hypothetical protein
LLQNDAASLLHRRGLSHLRGRSRFGAAKARPSNVLLLEAKTVDARDKPGKTVRPFCIAAKLPHSPC